MKLAKWEDYDRELLRLNTNTDGTRQWTYQFCTEFGWFQIPSELDKKHRMRSPALNVTYWRDLCSDLFGKDSAKLLAKNLRSIGAQQKLGKVLYVNSVEDPWLGVSVLPAEKPEVIQYVDKLTAESEHQSLMVVD